MTASSANARRARATEGPAGWALSKPLAPLPPDLCALVLSAIAWAAMPACWLPRWEVAQVPGNDALTLFGITLVGAPTDSGRKLLLAVLPSVAGCAALLLLTA